MPFKIIRDKSEASMVDGIVLERSASPIMPVGNLNFQENEHSHPYRYELFALTHPKNEDDNTIVLFTYYQRILLEAKTLGISAILIIPQSHSVEMAKKAIEEFLQENDMMIYMLCVNQEITNNKPSNIELAQYIERHYTGDIPPVYKPSTSNPIQPSFLSQASIPQKSVSLHDALNQMEDSFSEMLLQKIDESGMSDAECYKKANIDRKLFSKIRNDRYYRPSKVTVLSFAIALELSLEDTNKMLKSAGFALSHSNKFDVILEYFISRGNYDIYEINDALFEYNQTLLGV